MRLLAMLVALALGLAACGEGDDESSEGETTTESDAASTDDSDQATGDESSGQEAEAPDNSGTDDATDDAMAADDAMGDDDAMSDDDGAMTEDNSMSDDAMSEDDLDMDEAFEDLLGDMGMLSFFWPEGSEPTDEDLACIESKGVDPNLSPFSAAEDDILRASVAISGCAPEEMAESLYSDVTPPEGTTADDVKCVMVETFQYIGSIPIDEAVELAGTGDTMGEDLRAAVSPTAEDVCGLSADEIDAIFDA
jgi:hypothetical protein